jgi:hypothetical protein
VPPPWVVPHLDIAKDRHARLLAGMPIGVGHQFRLQRREETLRDRVDVSTMPRLSATESPDFIKALFTFWSAYRVEFGRCIYAVPSFSSVPHLHEMTNILFAFLLVACASPPLLRPPNQQKAATKSSSTQGQHEDSTKPPLSVKLLNTGKSEKETAQDSQRIESTEKESSRNFWLAVVVTIATVVSAIALFITIGDAKKTTRIQLRGYVFFQKRVKWAPTGLNIRFRNAGQTPVRNVEVVGYVSSASTTHTGSLPPTSRATDHFVATMAPQGELDVHFTSSLLRATLEDSIREMAAGTTVYVHGEVTYTDAYDTQRWTKFRYRFTGNDLRNCTEGNDWN